MAEERPDLFIFDETRDVNDPAKPSQVTASALTAPRTTRSAAYYRTLYKDRLDFKLLASEDAEFAKL